MYRNTPKSVQFFALPCCCMVAGSRRRGTWISTNYTRSLGKWSRFQQHLVSCIPAWQTIVVGILDGEYSMYGGLDAKASTMLLFVGVTVHNFIVIRWINNKFGSDSVLIHLQRWIGLNAHSIRIAPNQIVNAKCECYQCTFNTHWIRF